MRRTRVRSGRLHQAQIINLLLDLQEERGLAYMFVTHDLSVVKYISDDIMVMYLGQMVEKASSDELFQNPLHPYTKALLSAIPIPSIRNKKNGSSCRARSRRPSIPNRDAGLRTGASMPPRVHGTAGAQRAHTEPLCRVLQKQCHKHN